MARRLRQQAIFCVAAHMYITLRLIYSWPMDSSYEASPGEFKKVNKYPNPAVLTYTVQDWHTSSQKALLPVYLIAFYVVLAGLIVTWIVLPLGSFTYRLLFKIHYPVSDANTTSFDDSKSVKAYVPLLKIGSEKFLCSYVDRIQAAHRPVLIRSIPEDKDDLSSYVPMEHQQKVLSIVKYYDDDDYEAQKSTSGQPPVAPKRAPPFVRTPPSSPQKKVNLSDILLLSNEDHNFLDSSPSVTTREKGGGTHSSSTGMRLNSSLPPIQVDTITPEHSPRHNRKVRKRLIVDIPTIPQSDMNEHKSDPSISTNNLSLPNSYRIVLQPLNRVRPLSD